ncbi:hypothetical protein WJX81_007016 [Elliptochloris bilobata]|uniref:JmjC domain-containing protein n=1 Tax=Elliptochloris bilobata TaxID=381761 RepID=A0AAW1QX02_9CHLO
MCITGALADWDVPARSSDLWRRWGASCVPVETRLGDALPELGERVPREPPLREAAGRVYQRSVWLGPAGTRTPLHRDPYHNLLCQAWGAKAVRLYAPKHAAALAPYPQHALRNTSQLDGGDPRLTGVPCWECELRATEALYIPRRWWHEVTATSASLSVSYWWT